MALWGVCITAPCRERWAQQNLERQGFPTYLPKYRERLFVNGRVCYRAAVLFKRYLFVGLTDAWHQVTRTAGVINVIRTSDNKPAILPESVVNELRARDAGGFIRLPELKVGQRVRITDGVFVGRLAIYQGMSGPEREAVLLSTLKVNLPAGSVVAA